jgi:hypothetical protein
MANWYVRPNGGSYGSENGTDWNNAFDGFSDIAWGSISPGDTIWVAGGTYTQSLQTGASGSSENPIAIRRARSDASACTSASGWSAGFDSTITHDSAEIALNSFNWLVISGATTASGGAIGWHITWAGDFEGAGVSYVGASTASNIIIEWIEMEGPGNVTYTGDGRGIDATPFSSATNFTVRHCKIHGWESAMYFSGITGVIVEHCEAYDIRAVNSATFHPNLAFILASNGIIFRYNYFHGYIGEGLFWTNNDDDAQDAQVIGNIFSGTSIGGTSTKCLQVDLLGTMTGMLVHNNTFDDCYNIIAGDAVFSGCIARNNIVSRNQSGGGNPFGSFTNSNTLVTTDSGVFVNRAGGDFHIVSTIGAGFARNAGTNLAGNFTLDFDGNTYGEDGTWDIGAYEYTDGGGDVVAPELDSATIQTNGTSIILAFDEAVTNGAGGATGWTLSLTGGAVTMTYSSGSGTSSHTYTLSRTVYSGQTGTLAYTQPTNGLEDGSGNDLVTFSGFTVTNNSSQNQPTASGRNSIRLVKLTGARRIQF